MAAVDDHYIRVDDGQEFIVIRIRSGYAWLTALPADETIPGVRLPVDELDDGATWSLVGG